MRIVIIAACLAIAVPAAATDVYRCTDANGHVEYRDSPCDRNSASQRVELAPNGNAVREIDQRAARAAGDAIGARAAARIAADAAEDERRRADAALEAERAMQVGQAESAPLPYYYGSGYVAPRVHHHKPRPPVLAIKRPPQSVPVDERKRRF